MLCDIIRYDLAEAAALNIFLQRYNVLMVLRQIVDHVRINGLYESAVYQRAGISFILQLLTDMFRCTDHAADSHERDIFLLVDHFALSVFERGALFLQTVVCDASRVADCDGAFQSEGKFHHVLKLPLILRCHDRHVRNR